MGVVCALQSEARHWGPLPSRQGATTALADGTLVAVAGMGMAAAERAALGLLADGAGALLSFGMAGGLEPQLTAGTIIVPAQVVGTAGAAQPTDPVWAGAVSDALAPHQKISGGVLLTSEVPVTSVAHKAQLLRDTGAVAVDMESLAIGQVAQARAVAFLVVRVIIDVATDALPGLVRDATGAGGEVRLARLLAHLLGQPAQLAPLLRLSRRYRTANRALAAAAGNAVLRRQAPRISASLA